MRQLSNVPLHDLWNTPLVEKRATLGFWWWFFFLVFKRPIHNLPRQFMTLWATKDVKETIVNDRRHRHVVGIRRSPEKDSFKGVVGSWYFDGEHMHHDVVLENAYCSIQRSPIPGIFAKGKAMFSLVPVNKGCSFKLESPRISIDIHWRLAQNNDYFMPIGEQKKFLAGILEQHIFRINRFTFEGSLTFNNTQERISGEGYFQRIVVNTPIPPWWWGLLFFDNGSMTKYFVPHISLSMFRRSIKDHPFPFENAFRHVSSNAEFYDVEKDEIYRFKKVYVRKYFKEDGLPIFQVEYKHPKGEVKYYLDCYSHSYFKMKNKIFETPLRSTLYYNEFPCVVRKFKLDLPGRHITQDRLGKGVGNCEHSWGIMF
ncbi:MAG: hypothetical protein ACTSW4_05150 [Candidatus Ranarchaeia archaeon]